MNGDSVDRVPPMLTWHELLRSEAALRDRVAAFLAETERMRAEIERLQTALYKAEADMRMEVLNLTDVADTLRAELPE